MGQRTGEQGDVADARTFQDSDALDLWFGDRFGNAALVGVQLDRSRLGGAGGQADFVPIQVGSDCRLVTTQTMMKRI